MPEQVGWEPPKTWPYMPYETEPFTIHYAATEVHVDRDTEVWLDIGADDDTRLWLNDELVWASVNRMKPWYQTPYPDLPTRATYGFVEGRVRVTVGPAPRADSPFHFQSEPGLELIQKASPGSAGRNKTLAVRRFEDLVIPLPPIEERLS